MTAPEEAMTDPKATRAADSLRREKQLQATLNKFGVPVAEAILASEAVSQDPVSAERVSRSAHPKAGPGGGIETAAAR
jgi:hypothetical protein